MNDDKFEKLAKINHHRIQQGRCIIDECGVELNKISNEQKIISNKLENIDLLLAEANSLLAGRSFESPSKNKELSLLLNELEMSPNIKTTRKKVFQKLDIINFDDNDDIDHFFEKNMIYARKHNVNLDVKISSFLSQKQIEDLNKFIDDQFTYKTAKCDEYDYLIAGTVGIISGIIDVLFVGMPKESKLTQLSDKAVDSLVEKSASFFGWDGPREGKNPTKSAIAFLERKFSVNYDQRHSGDVDNIFKMSAKNHHIKSLGHSPDIIGLLFSIIDQFTSTSHFISNGKLISIDTEKYELQGTNIISKIYCGFVNWLGHLLSDVAGSSGAKDRGSGIPIPFFNLFQLVNIGDFGQYKQTYATVCVQVFEQGYDFRHGIAMAIPVMFNELIIRLMYFIKNFFYTKKELTQCLPNASNPELHRMLFVGYAVFCSIDAGDAVMRSGGEIITFLLRTNLLAWVRFCKLSEKELISIIKKGHIDEEQIDKYIENEYRKIIKQH